MVIYAAQLWNEREKEKKRTKDCIKTTKLKFYLGKGEVITVSVFLNCLGSHCCIILLNLCEYVSWLQFHFMILYITPGPTHIHICSSRANAHIMINNVNLYRFQIKQCA